MKHGSEIKSGGIAEFFVRHREVSWLTLFAVLAWGWFSYTKLPQQEDPKIPNRGAVLVTVFPGASPAKMEELVTKKLEKTISELQSVDEIKSESRFGVSVITVRLLSEDQTQIDLEWSKLRAKIQNVTLPDGCYSPQLDTDFDNTVTLLFSITSANPNEAQNQARADLIRRELETLRAQKTSSNRVAIVAFFPPGISSDYRALTRERFQNMVLAEKIGSDIRTSQGRSFILADFASSATRNDIDLFVGKFIRQLAGSDVEVHPDLGLPLILMPGDDIYKEVQSKAMPLHTYRQLEVAAEYLEDELKQLPGAGRVRKLGIVQENVSLVFSVATLNGYALTTEHVMQAIAARNALIPGGSMRTEGHIFPVKLTGEFKNERQLLDTVVGLNKEQMPIYLRDIFDVRRGYANPIPFKVDTLINDTNASPGSNSPFTLHRSVIVAVEMKDGHIISDFNNEAREVISQVQERLPDGMQIVTISDQPGAVAGRIHQFTKCFIEAVLIVVAICLFLMDWRSAMVVAIAIPLTIALTLAGMNIFHIPLHQISIAALIIALGMLVDDPVVASDGINRELAHGEPRERAAWLGPYKLRRPILFGTLINIVAFLPLVLLPGDKGVFIFALPMVVTLSLVASRIVSMTFVPLIGFYLLQGQKGFESGGEVRSFFLFKPVDLFMMKFLPRYRSILTAALAHPWRASSIAFAMLGLSFGFIPYLGEQFFPPAERNQFLVNIELPESASLTQTRDACQIAGQILKRHPEIVSAAIFSGGTAPRFYYNVEPREQATFLAQILINTRNAADVPRLLVQLRHEMDQEIAGARCLVRQLEHGVPIDAPIQIRLRGDNLDKLRRMADEVSDVLREAGGYHVHDDLGRRMPSLQIDIDQDRANTLGIGNMAIGRLAQAAFTGIKVTELREGDHLIPVEIRLRVEERNEADKIRTMYVSSPLSPGRPIPISSFATVGIDPEYATIAHYNQLRTVTVKSFSPYDVLPSKVLAKARPAIKALKPPQGCTIEFGGEAKELRQMRSEMNMVIMVSLSLIALSIVFQFNSVMKALVVLLTVPLGLIGALFGLAVTHAPLGFMALLGIVSLAGVIVSHIIVLSDFIEESREEGMPLKDALLLSGLVRLRAVMVTVLATVGGLIPLAFTGGELWHPLTSVHIFGLLFATALTLVVLPAIYLIFCDRLKLIK